MKTFNTQFTNNSNLINFINNNKLNTNENVLIQVFSGIIDKEQILNITALLKKHIPNANIIGTTSAGEISNGEMLDNSILITFTIFKSTIVKSKLIDLKKDLNIENTIDSIISHNTKALIIFSDGLKSNAEELLKNLTISNPDIIIAGGRAADILNFKTTLVFNHQIAVENGFVVASLSGDDLIVNSDYILNWNQIGKEMIVTKSDGNIVYEIDNIEIKELYKKYLGPEISEKLPSSGTEFPLITIRDGIKVARSPIAILEDNSLLFAGNLNVGEKVRFSYGNINDIKDSIYDNNIKFAKLPIESIFIYSCIGRKTLIGKELEAEFKMLNSLATTAGFFTFGEYFHSSKVNEILNITTTFLALSETSQVTEKEIYAIPNNNQNRILKALINLSDVTTKEIEFQNKELSRLNDMISKSVLYSTTDLNGNIITMSKAYLDFLGLKDKDVIGKNHNLFRHPSTPDSFYMQMWEKLNKNEKFIGEVLNKKNDNSEYWIKIIVDPLFNEYGEKIGYSSYKENITDKKYLEYISRHDSLTGLYNKGAFTKHLDIKLKIAQRYQEEFSFAIFDIDHFKRINDIYGHKIGDDVLIKLAECLSTHIRADDFLARWGGEEFVLIVNHTNLEQLILLIKKLQNEIKRIEIVPDKVTFSFGITIYKNGDTKESLFQRADEALYMAKEKGRNRYEVIL